MLEPLSEGVGVNKAERCYSRQRQKQHVQRPPVIEHGPCSWNKESEREDTDREAGRTSPSRTLCAMLRILSLLQEH